MTTDLLTKANALLEAREKITFRREPQEWSRRKVDDEGYVYIPQGSYLGDTLVMLGDTYENSAKDCDYVALAANTACDTIQGYQDLVRRMTDAIERLIAGNLDMDELGEAKLLLDEARVAILHDATNV